jgi:uncharacterized protein (TIGR00266 family)
MRPTVFHVQKAPPTRGFLFSPEPDNIAGMNHAILFDPSFSMLEVELVPGEVLQAEAGSMVSRSRNIAMKTRMNAGAAVGFWKKCRSLLIALIKKVLGGESFFVNEFSSSDGAPATVTVAPVMPGSIIHRRLEREAFILQGGAYLASRGALAVKVRFAGLKALFSGHGLFFLEISGSGDVFFSAYGGVMEQAIDGQFTLDTGHLVGFDPTLDYKIAKAGNLKSTLFSGEGLVMNFSGKGRLFLQSRNIGALVSFVNPRLPTS